MFIINFLKKAYKIFTQGSLKLRNYYSSFNAQKTGNNLIECNYHNPIRWLLSHLRPRGPNFYNNPTRLKHQQPQIHCLQECSTWSKFSLERDPLRRLLWLIWAFSVRISKIMLPKHSKLRLLSYLHLQALILEEALIRVKRIIRTIIYHNSSRPPPKTISNPPAVGGCRHLRQFWVIKA